LLGVWVGRRKRGGEGEGEGGVGVIEQLPSDIIHIIELLSINVKISVYKLTFL